MSMKSYTVVTPVGQPIARYANFSEFATFVKASYPAEFTDEVTDHPVGVHEIKDKDGKILATVNVTDDGK